MFQLTYKIEQVDDFLHQISQLGAHFVSKGPETETYFKTPKHQLRLDEGISHELVLIKKIDHYQELIDIDIQHYNSLREILIEVLGERVRLTKQVIRYYLKDVLIIIHRYENLGQLLMLQAESIATCKDLARQLNLNDHDRLTETSAELSEK